jgi:DNA-binding NarL/FixJ family response regulator
LCEAISRSRSANWLVSVLDLEQAQPFPCTTKEPLRYQDAFGWWLSNLFISSGSIKPGTHGMAKRPISVLVVDDYEPFRRFVTSTVGQQPELQTIGEASDGLEAVRKAQELEPDLILLDIGLPTLNGIEAARLIREHSPKAKILFLSENRSSDIAEEALHTGACGYIVKSDAGGELLPAVDAVLQGKQFVSSSLPGHHVNQNRGDHALRKSAPLPPHNGGIVGHHEVVFYSDDRQFLDNVSQFIGAALNAGNAAIGILTDSHQDSLVRRLQAYSVDIAADIEQGRYIALDAADALSTFMINGMLESDRFLESFGKLILKAAKAAKGEHPRVAIVGEGADLLRRQGNAEAAIQDEKLCNQLTKRYDVDILCGYSLRNDRSVVDDEVIQQIYAEHSAVYHP